MVSTSDRDPLPPEREAKFFAGVRAAGEFLTGRGDVAINVFLAGDYPGDGKPKAVRFPDPAVAANRGERVRLLPLETAIELKIASGISAPHRLRDLADVLELIRICDLPADFRERLDESVRAKFGELWQAAQYGRS